MEAKSYGTKTDSFSNGLAVPHNPTVLLEMLERQMSEENGRAAELICRIQDKLHRIADRRTPEKGEETTGPANSDFSTAISTQLCAMANNNYRLERVLNHLSEII